MVMEKEESRPGGRRAFLSYMMSGAFGLLATFGLYSVGRYLWPPTGVSGGGGAARVEVGPVEELPEGSGKKVLYKNEPVWVIHAPFGFVALSAVCTHLGCIVEYEPEKDIWCPCHAAFFDLRGNVKSGPAPRALPAYPVAVVDGKIILGES